MTTLATLFRAILTGLQAVIAPIAARDRTRTEFLVRVHIRLNKAMQRFETLVAHWRNNTLPKQRTRPGRKPRPNTTPRLPTRKAWLVRDLNHYEANIRAMQLQTFLATEDCTRFLAEVPRATRILRPIATALGLQMPGDPPPKPAPAPRPSKNPWLNLPPAPPPPVETRLPPSYFHPAFSKAR